MTVPSGIGEEAARTVEDCLYSAKVAPFFNAEKRTANYHTAGAQHLGLRNRARFFRANACFVRTVSVVMVLATLLVAPVVAQTIRGVVVEVGAGTPVGGAMVVLVDSGGVVERRVLTDGLGRYVLEPEALGVHSIRVDRIGYESVSTGSFTVGQEGVTKNIDVAVQAIELPGLDVYGSRRCQVRPAEGQATAELWEEARKALQATAWTLDQGVYTYTLLNYTRALDRRGVRVLDERREFIHGRSHVPYESLPAEQLVEGGFVQTSEDGSTSYFAPDAAVLLSDPFLDTHCMRLKDDPDALVGLELEPIPGRRLPDIEGTLWVDRTTGYLERLDFRYVNLPAGTGELGGEVVFGGLPNGTWVVREWRIRMPRIGVRITTGRVERVGYRDEGGIVWQIIDRDGTTLLEATAPPLDSLGLEAPAPVVAAVVGAEPAAPLSSQWQGEPHIVRGVVRDAVNGSPLPRARLRFDELNRGTLADDAGRFEFAGILAGVHVLTVEQYGYSPIATNVDVSGEAPTSMDIELTPRPVMLDGLTVVADRLALMETRLVRRRSAATVSSRAFEQERLVRSPATDLLDFLRLDAAVPLTACPVGRPGGWCVARRGEPVEPTLYIDEELVFGGLQELATYRPHDFHLIEVYSFGEEIRAYTHRFMERVAEEPIALFPIGIGRY
jgi:hypothetical protein